MSNGRYAMTLISRYICKMPANSSCHQFCKGVSAYVFKHYKVPILPFLTPKSLLQRLALHPEERLTASVVIYSRLRREVWMIGDCLCLIGGELYENPKPYEDVLAEMRAKKVQELLAAGQTAEEILANDTARASVIPRMLEEMQNQNKTYAVVDGFPIPEAKVRVLTLDFRPWEIVFASDGYPFLCRTLEESEARLAQQKANDPLNIGEFKATKGFAPGNNSFDDRTFIRFKV